MGKRMAALALAVCMALPLFGCGGKLKAQSLTEGITVRTIDTHTDLTGDSTAVMDFAAALLRQTAASQAVTQRLRNASNVGMAVSSGRDSHWAIMRSKMFSWA